MPKQSIAPFTRPWLQLGFHPSVVDQIVTILWSLLYVAKNGTKHWNVIKNNGDNADSNNRATNSKTEITKNASGDNSKENNQSFALKEAFDSTIIPLRYNYIFDKYY